MVQPKILLVEDEADVIYNTKKHLEWQGYEVECAETLAAASKLLHSSPPDLILLDVMLPDGSGYDFCAEIRSVTTAPIIYMTCLDKNEDVVRGLTGGGDDYITKPFDFNVLSARIVAQLRRAGINNAGKFELPPLSIDLQKGQVVLRGEVILLSYTELRILAFFMNHPGRLFTPDEIYEAAWGGVPENVANTVKMRISSVRKKLKFDQDDSPFEIRSPRNKGYIFIRLVDEPEW